MATGTAPAGPKRSMAAKEMANSSDMAPLFVVVPLLRGAVPPQVDLFAADQRGQHQEQDQFPPAHRHRRETGASQVATSAADPR